MPLEMPKSILGLFALQFVGATLLYFVLAGLSHLVFFVWRKPRAFPGQATDRGQRGLAIKWTMIAMAGNAALSTPFQWGVSHGYSKIYWSVDEHGWGWIAISALLFLAITETAIYWIHRGLHTRRLYKSLHVYHHRFRVPTPWASLAFHPLDSFAQALPHFACAFLFPVHIAVYLGFVTYVTVWAVMIHDRTSFVTWPGINYTDHHTVHHVYNKDNYGQFFTLWDRIGGTYRSPKVLEKAAHARAPAAPVEVEAAAAAATGVQLS